jgi:hypothetical protein
MILPSMPVELSEELELELPLRSAIELAINDEMTDCADSAPAEDVAADVVADEAAALLPVRALRRFKNAALRLEATLPEAPEPPARLSSNSLSPDSVARLVSAAIAEATFVPELAVGPEAPLGVEPV